MHSCSETAFARPEEMEPAGTSPHLRC